MLGTPREVLGDHARQRLLGVDRPRVDVQQRALAGNRVLAARGRASLAQQVHQVGGVARVQHAEAARQAERRRVPAHEPVRHRVKRPAQHARRRGHQPARPRSISRAARRVNVSSRIRSAGTPR